MDLWVITSPYNFSSEYDDIEEMFNHGLKNLILYKKSKNTQNDADFFEYERWLLGLSIEYRKKIWIKGPPNWVNQLDVAGCICEIDNLNKEIFENWKKTNTIILCNSINESNTIPNWASFILLGPVFQPLSFTNDKIIPIYESMSRSLNNVLVKVPLILWGGVDIDTISILKKFSPTGVASLGGIWNYADPINAFIKLNRACK